MKTAIRITGIHALLVALLSILANIDSAAWCSGPCDFFSYIGALAFLVLVYPGLMVATYFVSYNGSEPVPTSVWIASVITTEAMLFILVSMLIKIFTRVRKT